MASTTRKSSTERSRAHQARAKRGDRDALIVPFPSNARGDDSPGAHLQSWGPGLDIPPMQAGNIVLVEKGKLICTFSLHIRLQGLGFYLYENKLVQWGEGQRVMLPERQVRSGVYRDLILIDTNATAKQFEEAALRAIRHALAEFYKRQAQAMPASTPEAVEPCETGLDDGVARGDVDDVPF